MARVTVEDSLKHAKNRFALVILAAQRVKQLMKGSRPLSEKSDNREVVTALREIAEGKVGYVHPEVLITKDERKLLESGGDGVLAAEEHTP
ncbi:MAG: DNA-directed RNA polymerase subunit omega [Deltaproteobacteria bacterium]|nr:DNA-directed RNA polymerase subunit omega [Deltaproteobacteria bacterium]